ncbi:MAG: hypothetical protein ACOCTP_02500 [Roseicyclus sp.]
MGKTSPRTTGLRGAVCDGAGAPVLPVLPGRPTPPRAGTAATADVIPREVGK